ncbi:hypothetical protein F5146DRAFT_530753 [Armillaria mellea]|nr:hypothetical protein F5146DRAFT_530753 [Armillaria mellea]
MSVLKPYACPNCSLGFGQIADLDRHQKTHLSGEERDAVSFKCPSYHLCGISSLQKSNLLTHIRKKHQTLIRLICFKCRGKLFIGDDIVALLQHQQDVHGILPAPVESPPSPLPMSLPSAVYNATSPVMSYPSSTIGQPVTCSSSSTHAHDPSSPKSSLPDELRGLLLHDGPPESQLANITVCGPLIWHPSHTLDVPPLSTVYNALPQAFYAGRPDLFSPPPSLYGGSTYYQGPSVVGNFLPQNNPPPPWSLPTPPPSRPSTTRPPSQPSQSQTH